MNRYRVSITNLANGRATDFGVVENSWEEALLKVGQLAEGGNLMELREPTGNMPLRVDIYFHA